ncbi:MAG TPA: NADH-quinone oxidoreductase subunit J [Pyrinomonadaceae bacterium]|jgi:NADH-quinone oxidoreductase subunit J|nr:NADH-quinone oxidoreductase subunit J [Pyrinomonadaceae bacterium]
MVGSILFYLFAGFAIACAAAMVWQKNPLYSAIALIGVFISLSLIYLTLAAPFIAVAQILVYAGAIMVLVVFVIMLLNLGDDDKSRKQRLGYLYGVGGGLGVILFLQTLFIFYAVLKSPAATNVSDKTSGRTISIGQTLFTQYLLPVEIVGVLLLMAIIGGVILSRRLDQPEIERLVEKELEIRKEEEKLEEPRISF